MIRTRRVKRGEEGFTLVETMVASALLIIVLGMCFTFMVSMQNVVSREDSRAQSNDQAALAAHEVDRQIRSGNVLYDPSQEGANAGTNPDGTAIPAGFSLRIYTQANGTERCVQWRVLNTKALQKRSWSEAWESDNQVSQWATVATGIVNTSSQPPFALDSSSGFGGSANSRLVNIDFVANNNTKKGASTEVQLSVSGRNTEYFPTNSGLCTDIPTP
jgi:type II secretory pathway component PulJ